MSKLKKSLMILLAIALCVSFNVNSFAEERINVEREARISQTNYIPTVTEKDITSGYEIIVSRDRRSYWKTVKLKAESDIPNPDRYYWSQEIYYTEPNPYGTGTATGYLDFVSAVPNGSGVNSTYTLTYSGYMYYYE